VSKAIKEGMVHDPVTRLTPVDRQEGQACEFASLHPQPYFGIQSKL
jgi:hypothetical protein